MRATREVVRHRGSVAALPVNEDGSLILVRQYRYAVGEALWELPAGRLDAGETPEGDPARAREEIGQRAGHIEKVAFFYTTPGFCDEAMHLFRATGLVPDQGSADEDERIEIGTLHARPGARDDRERGAARRQDAGRRASRARAAARSQEHWSRDQ